MQIYSTQTGMNADAKAVIKDIKLVDNRESGLLFGDSRTDFCRKNCGCACMGGCAYRRRKFTLETVGDSVYVNADIVTKENFTVSFEILFA